MKMKVSVRLPNKKKVSQVVSMLLTMTPEELKEVHLWLYQFVEADKVIVQLGKRKRL